MAELRIRLEINRGDQGINLNTLASVAAESQRFLRMVGEDVGIDSAIWDAGDFQNGSISFSVESRGEADEEQVRLYSRTIEHILDYDPFSTLADQPRGVRNETLTQFARITSALQPDESMRMGLYANGDEVPAWRELSRGQAANIREYFEEWLTCTGMVQGVIHSLYKETQPPYFDVRDLATGQLVKCLFNKRDYGQVVELLKRRDAIVIISGELKTRRVDRKVDRLVVQHMQTAPDMDAETLEKFFGCAPDFTGPQTTGEFIDAMRKDGD